MATEAPTTNSKAAGEEDEVCLNLLPTDAFVEILLRLHASKRWRLRLVCRRWRDVIQDRTPAPSRPVPLAFVASYADGLEIYALAYAVEDLNDGRCKEIWRSKNPRPTRVYEGYRCVYTNRFETRMVDTCNGVLCLCDETVPGGAISLVNPVTGETQAAPRLPGSAQWRQWGMARHQAYSFSYDTTMERYTVVHVPCYFDNTAGFNFVQVFTFTPGAAAVAAWHDVPVPGGTCCLNAGIVSIDGAAYWITMGMERVVSLDIKEERVTFTKALPKRDDSGYTWHLTKVHWNKLGVVSSAVDSRRTPEKIEVWVLGDGREWSRRYSVQVNGVQERIARPHFAHGDHVLLTGSDEVAYGHRLKNATGRLQSGEVLSVRVSMKTPGVGVSGISGNIMGMFSYVKNTEPLCASS